MKKYTLFVGSQYYPRGGWMDLHGEFDSVLEAESCVNDNPTFQDQEGGMECNIEWAHVVDTTTQQIVWVYRARFNQATRRAETTWAAS